MAEVCVSLFSEGSEEDPGPGGGRGGVRVAGPGSGEEERGRVLSVLVPQRQDDPSGGDDVRPVGDVFQVSLRSQVCL